MKTNTVFAPLIVGLLCVSLIFAGCQTPGGTTGGITLPVWAENVLVAAQNLLQDLEAGNTSQINADLTALEAALTGAKAAETKAIAEKSLSLANIQAVIANVKVVIADFASGSTASTATKIKDVLAVLMSIYALVL